MALSPLLTRLKYSDAAEAAERRAAEEAIARQRAIEDEARMRIAREEEARRKAEADAAAWRAYVTCINFCFKLFFFLVLLKKRHAALHGMHTTPIKPRLQLPCIRLLRPLLSHKTPTLRVPGKFGSSRTANTLGSVGSSQIVIRISSEA